MAPPSHLSIARSPSGAASSCGWRTGSSQSALGPAELFGQRISLSEMRAARQVIADGTGKRRRIATGAELYFKSVPSRGGLVLEVQGRGSLRAVGGRPDRAPHAAGARRGPSTTTACATCRRVRFTAKRPAPPVLRALQPGARPSATVTLGTSVGWADVYPSTYSGQLDRRHGAGGLLRRRAARRSRAPTSSSPTRPTNVSSTIVRLPFKPGSSALPAGWRPPRDGARPRRHPRARRTSRGWRASSSPAGPRGAPCRSASWAARPRKSTMRGLLVRRGLGLDVVLQLAGQRRRMGPWPSRQHDDRAHHGAALVVGRRDDRRPRPRRDAPRARTRPRTGRCDSRPR